MSISHNQSQLDTSNFDIDVQYIDSDTYSLAWN